MWASWHSVYWIRLVIRLFLGSKQGHLSEASATPPLGTKVQRPNLTSLDRISNNGTHHNTFPRPSACHLMWIPLGRFSLKEELNESEYIRSSIICNNWDKVIKETKLKFYEIVALSILFYGNTRSLRRHRTTIYKWNFLEWCTRSDSTCKRRNKDQIKH